ncbi:MAG: TetR/AcrR family transcriptional regulator [Deltaproteobacteria bacterium]|nr:MAG: TetR/AcrR family transcriptional regulator [Deltaproteobacteria bacterium]
MTAIDSHRLQKRDRIIDAAVEVFAEKGFRAARISDIASRAGVADGTIYLYFKNKEDLLLVIFEEKMELLLEELQAALDGIDDPIDRIRAYAGHHFRSIVNHPALAQVLQVELRQSHRFLREYRPEKLWEYLGVFADLVRQGQARGQIRQDVDPFLAQWAFFGALDEISIQWVLARRRERFNLDQAAEQVVGIFLRGMVPQGDHASPSAPSTPSADAGGRRST